MMTATTPNGVCGITVNETQKVDLYLCPAKKTMTSYSPTSLVLAGGGKSIGYTLEIDPPPEGIVIETVLRLPPGVMTVMLPLPLVSHVTVIVVVPPGDGITSGLHVTLTETAPAIPISINVNIIAMGINNFFITTPYKCLFGFI